MRYLSAVLVACCFQAGAQSATDKLPQAIERLTAAAQETVDVTLDPEMIRSAERFLSDRKPDEAKAKRVLRNVNQIRVRVFEFDREGAYTVADLQALRRPVRGSEWSRVVEVRSRGTGENVDVFVRSVNGEVAGLFVISAEPRELAIVEIDGKLHPADLADVGGYAGLPRWLSSRNTGVR